MVVKSYRGLLPSGGQEKIRLNTTDGLMGYSIMKFEAFPPAPGTSNYEAGLMIWKVKQTTVSVDTPAVDFTDSDLLAALYIEGASSNTNTDSLHVIFDNEVFNQDIYITLNDTSSGTMNYYIELEQIKLTAAQAELLIVKSLRGEVWTRP